MKAVVAAAEREPERFGNLVEEMDRLRRVNGVYRKLIVGGKVAAIRAAPRGWPTSPATASASRGASMMFLATSTDGDSTRARATWQYVPSGAAQAITADGLRDLYWTVRAPHRGNAVWVMSSATANAVDKLKSGTGNYLWRDASSSSVPPMLLGRPVQFDVNMPAVWGGNCPIAFVFSGGYLIVDHAGLKFLRDAYSDSRTSIFISIVGPAAAWR